MQSGCRLRDYLSRLISGLTYKLTRAVAGSNPGQWGNLLDFGAGQFPSANPVVTIPYAWEQALTGHNPVDSFRGGNIIPDRNFSAGGVNVLGPMFQWTLSESGYNNFFAWNPHAQTTGELLFSAIPGVNRMVVVTDFGMREQQRQEEANKAGVRDREFLKLDKQVQSLVAEHGMLERLGANRTTEQQMRYARLHTWHSEIYSPAWESIRLAAEQGRDTSSERVMLARLSSGFKR